MIVTFYSYKGGVGRSMALANVAKWLQLQGLRVVMIDWDLEAPGLESFFAPAQEERDVLRGKLGLIDLLVAYKDIFPSLPKEAPDPDSSAAADPGRTVRTKTAEDEPPLAAEVAGRRRARALRIARALSDALPPLVHVLVPLKPAPPPASSAGRATAQGPGALSLLPAGSRTGAKFASYAETVQDFDWEQFYASYEGEAYFEWFRGQLLQPGVADVVLIDSRTGVAEMSGACTRQMADVIVMLCAPNDQNLEGIERMAESFIRPAIIAARGERPIDIIMVPARVDVSEGRPVDVFEANFHSKLDRFAATRLKNLGVGFSKLRIPYISAYAYAERLAIGDPEGVKTLQDAYMTLAAHIAVLAPVGSPIRAAARDAIQQTFGLPTVIVLQVDAEDFETAYLCGELQRRLEAAGTMTVAAKTFDVVLDPELQRRGPGGASVPLVIPVNDRLLSDRRVRDACRRASEQGISATLVTRGPVPAPIDKRPRWMKRARIFDAETQFEDLLAKVLSPTRVARTPFTAPPLPDTFVDRVEDIERLRGDLLRTGVVGRTVGVAVVGAGGIGKSAVATAVCHDDEVIDFFDDGIVWASLGPGANLLDVYSRLVASFSGEMPLFQTAEEARRALVDLLAAKQSLLVLDDVWEASQLVPLGASSTTRVLVTTRAHEIAAEVGKVVTLGPLPARAAEDLLGANLSGLDPGAVGRLAARLEGLPLALRLANRIIRTRVEMGDASSLAVSRLFAEFDDEGLAALDLGDTQDAGASVLSAFRLSAERLTPADRARLPLLARIEPGAAVPLEQAAAEIGAGNAEAETLFRRLASASLIDFDAAKQAVVVPRLSRLFFESLEVRQKQADAGLAQSAQPEGPRIFISYDRAETKAYSNRITDRLARHFGYESVFLDVTSITPGTNWYDETERAVSGAGVVVALIGPSWVARLEPNRPVANELSTAFRLGVMVIPVLIDGASMPVGKDLPSELAPLAELHALTISPSGFQRDMDTLVKVIENLPVAKPVARPQVPIPQVPTPSIPAPAAASRPSRRWLGLGAAAALALMVGLSWTSLRKATAPNSMTMASETSTDERVGEAFRMRDGGDIAGAIALLSQLLDGPAPPAVRAQALRDRAFCYKLQKNWIKSIADLSTALALGNSSSDATGQVLKDRANAYLEIPDFDAALADFDTLTQLKPDDREGFAARDALRAFLKPTKGFLFVFPQPGVTSPAMLPLAVQKLDQVSFLNLRFWWHPIPTTAVRYTNAADEQMASTIVQRLRAARLDVKEPTLLSGTIPRSRRVEVWLGPL